MIFIVVTYSIHVLKFTFTILMYNVVVIWTLLQGTITFQQNSPCSSYEHGIVYLLHKLDMLK